MRRRMMMLRMIMWRRRTDPKTATHTLCEPAQSKCMLTFHKSHFIRKFTGKMPAPRVSSPDQAPARTLTVRTPQCGHTVWGKIYFPGFLHICPFSGTHPGQPGNPCHPLGHHHQAVLPEAHGSLIQLGRLPRGRLGHGAVGPDGPQHWDGQKIMRFTDLTYCKLSLSVGIHVFCLYVNIYLSISLSIYLSIYLYI